MGRIIKRWIGSGGVVTKLATDTLGIAVGEAIRLSGVRKFASDSLSLSLGELSQLNGIRKFASDTLSVSVLEVATRRVTFQKLISQDAISVALGELGRVSGPGVVSLQNTSYNVQEGSALSFTVLRGFGDIGIISVDWAISISQGAPSVIAGTVTFADRDSVPKTVNLTTTLVTATATGTISLSNAQNLSGGAAPTIGTPSASLTVTNIVPGSQVTDIQLTSAANSGTYGFYVGQGFKEGDVPAGQAVISDTPGVTLRCVPLCVWNDGSLKHAALIGSKAFVKDQITTLALKRGTATTGTNMTATNIANAAVNVVVNYPGIGSVTLASLVGSPFQTLISTPEMVECHYLSELDINTPVWLHVRLWATGQMRVRFVGDYGYLNTSPSDRTFTPSITVGATVIFASQITQQHHTRWTAIGWIGADPQIIPKHNRLYLDSTKLHPHYVWNNPSPAALADLETDYFPMDRGPLRQNTSLVGGDGTIGPITIEGSLALSSGSPIAFRAAEATGMAHGCYSVHRRSAASKRIPKPSDFPAVTYAGSGNGTETVSNNATVWDVAHAPNAEYAPYLLTADYFYYEGMGFSAQSYYFCHRSNGNGAGVLRRLRNDFQNRALGWGFNLLGRFIGLAPTLVSAAEAAIVADYRTWFSNVIDDFLAQCTIPGQNTIGIPYEYSTDDQWTPPTHGGIAIWMNDYNYTGLAMAIDMQPFADMTNAKALETHLAKAVVGRGGGSGPTEYNFTRAAQYGVVVDPTATGPNPDFGPDETNFYDNWGQVFQASHGVPNGNFGNTLTGGSASNPTESPNGYWGYWMFALSYCVDHGIPGAVAAMARLQGATNWNVVRDSGFDDTPNFGALPRFSDTVLSAAAARLGPGQCIKVRSIPNVNISFEAGPMFKWATKASFNPVRRSIQFVGKAEGVQPTHMVEYLLDTNTFQNPAVWSTGSNNGHAYDHNAGDPSSGIHYYREYNSTTIRTYSPAGVWGSTDIGVIMEITIGLCVFPGVGLLAFDGDQMRKMDLATGVWSQVFTKVDINNSYYFVSAYNKNANQMLYGGGNADIPMKRLSANLTTVAIATPPFFMGAGEFQSSISADPNTNDFVAVKRGSGTLWSRQSGTTWSAISQSTGDGTNPQNGAPNVVSGAGNVGGAKLLFDIPKESLGLSYGVVGCWDFVGGGADFWAWRP